MLQIPLWHLDCEYLECISGKWFWIPAYSKHGIRMNEKPAN